jgi:O-antigen/teichoic acid export membrane protein
MTEPRVGARSTLALALATGAGNVLAYVFTVAMSRLLGSNDFGELGTLLGVWLIAQIPAVACQLTAARELAAGSADAGGMLWLGVRLGAVLTVVLAAAAVPLAALLHVGVLAVLMLALGQLPITVLFAALGVLQGRSAFAGYGLLLAGFQAARLVTGGLVAAAGGGPSAVLAAGAVATLVAAVGGWLACRVPFARRPADGVAGHLLRGTASMGGLLLLTTADLLLAGHFLTGDVRGVYASGNVLTRIAFWGPQFIGTLAYPWLARPADRARARRLALLAVGGLAVAGVLVALLAGRPLVRLVFGDDYASLGPLAPLFVLVGAAAAVMNVVLLDDVATGRGLGTRLAYVAIAVEAVCVAAWWHASPGQVVGTAAVVVSATAVLAVLVTNASPSGPPTGRHAVIRRGSVLRRPGRHAAETADEEDGADQRLP